MKSSGVDNFNIMDNLQVYFLAMFVFLLVLGVLTVLAAFPCIRQRISLILREQISGFFFNGLINSLNIAYLTSSILAVASIQSYIINSRMVTKNFYEGEMTLRYSVPSGDADISTLL